MIYLMLGTALMLSAVAAYYSIAGLVAIFAAAVIPIIVMGVVLEVAKLVVASWLYRNWNRIPIFMKTYFTTALVVLMLLTSMGIFGFLSKAHLDQELPSSEIAAQVQLLDQKISVQKDIINDNRAVLRQLDEAVNQTMGRSTSEQGAARSVSIRKAQTKERTAANKSIELAQTEVNKLLEQRAPIASQLREVEAEVGPIKYIAALIYGDVSDSSMLEKAVRIVILMIVFVFDPLAVLMLMAVNLTLKEKNNDNNNEKPSTKEKTWDEFFQRREESTSDETSDETTSEETSDETTSVEDSSREQPTPEATSEETSPPTSYESYRDRNRRRRAKRLRRTKENFMGNNQVLVPITKNEVTPEVVTSAKRHSEVVQVLSKPTSGRPERMRSHDDDN